MAPTHRIQNAPVEDRLAGQPRGFGFFQAVRLIEGRAYRGERTRGRLSLVGEEADPQHRAVAFRAAAHLSYPQSEIDSISLPSDPPEMEVNFIGLTGPSGVLPQHYTGLLIRELRRRNRALRDFFDMLNHRMIAFFYRAWAKYRVPISIERDGVRGDDSATELLRALIGCGTARPTSADQIPQSYFLHYSGFFSHLPRNAISLQNLLMDYFELPIRIEPFRGRWLPLPEAERSTIGATGRFARLAIDAAAGDSYWDVQGSFAIIVGPIGYAEFLQFMPNGTKHREIAELARLYIDPHLGFRLELILARREIPRAQLAAASAAAPRLGWNLWLHHYPATEDARDAGWYF